MSSFAGPKAVLSLLFLFFAAVLAFVPFGDSFTAFGQNAASTPTPTPEPAFDRRAAVEQIREAIKGKENEPAEKVFKNIKILTGIPAGRIIGIMGGGFSRSLGVDCTHCHTPGDWASDSKQPKLIARDMWNMRDTINDQLLKNMKSLGDRKAIVNCTTCHRGEVKPATNMPRPEGQ